MTKQITIRMPKELLAKWLAALRSGEYRQAKGIMRDSDGSYCCLGVLAKIAGGDESEFSRGTPSSEFMDANQIKFDIGGFCNPMLPAFNTEATVANDNGRTFAEIADAIEACAEGF